MPVCWRRRCRRRRRRRRRCCFCCFFFFCCCCCCRRCDACGNKAFAAAKPDDKLFAIDVECVATGIRSTDRATARVVLVDSQLRTVFDEYVFR